MCRCVTYLMSSMARRAELQTMSRITELFSVCCFWIFAHLGQTNDERKKNMKQKWNVCLEVTDDKRSIQREFRSITDPVWGKRRGCASGRYRTGSRSLEHVGGQTWPWWINTSADMDWALELKGAGALTHPAGSAPPVRSQSACLRSRERPCSAGRLHSPASAQRWPTRLWWSSSSSAKQSRIGGSTHRHTLYSPLHWAAAAASLCSSRCRHTHLPLFLGFSWLFILSLFLLRGYTLTLWRGQTEHTFQAKYLYI